MTAQPFTADDGLIVNTTLIVAQSGVVNVGGNVAISGNLTVNVSSANVYSASANVKVGSNVVINTSTVFVGNSTVNTVINSSSISTSSLITTFANSVQFLSNTAGAVLDPTGIWASGTFVSIASAATITLDFSQGTNFATTLSTNTTLANPINAKPGQTSVYLISQDSTGGRTMSFGNNIYWASGLKPVLSVPQSVSDVLFMQVVSPTVIVVSLLKSLSQS